MKTSFRIVFSLVFIFSVLPFSVFADEEIPPPPPETCPPLCADTTPPVITAPADQSFATTTIPATPVLVAATATDETDPSPAVTYTPQSFSLGTTTVIWTATDATGNIATTSSQVGIYTPAPAETATIKIYVDTTLATSAVVTLPASGSPDVSLTPTGDAAQTALARSAIAILASLDAQTTDFDVTQLDYYGGLGFQVSCVSIPSSTSTPLCTLFPPSWLFAINGSAPTVGMSAVELGDGDVMQLYYSYASSRQAVIIDSSVVTGSPFTVEAQELDPATGSYHPTTGFTVDVGTVSGFTFTTLQSSPVDANGRATFTLSATGTYAVALQEDFDFPSTSFVVNEPAPPSNSGGGGGDIVHFQLNGPSALAYLASKQSEGGSFNAPLYSDWVALAFAATDPGEAKTKLRNYLLTASPTLSSATDYERHAMALMALDINPYSGTPVDYIARITGTFDGTQIGDSNLDNDDIFALFPLLHAGYRADDDMIKKIVAFIISAQTASGSWDGSVDMTAAAVQALVPLSSLPDVPAALTKAEAYLRAQQQTNGGFGSSFSTSWALQAIAALGQPMSSWQPSGLSPNDYLASLQQADGGVDATAISTDNRVWATAYAIPASLGKTWNSLLPSYSKPTSLVSNSGAITAVSSATSTIPLVATSTPTAATSTAIVTSTILTTKATTTPAQEISPVIVQGQAPLRATTAPAPPRQAREIAALETIPAPEESGITTESAQLAAAAIGTTDINWWIFLAALALLLLIIAAIAWSSRKKNR